MAAEIDRPYVYIIRSNTPGVTLPIEMDPKYELMPSELRVTNSYGSKTARVRYLEKIQVGPDSLGGEIEQALRAGEQPFVVVDNVIKASRIFQLLQHLELLSRRVVISVSGLSGAGKSEFSSILGSYLVEAECPAYILSVDNYYLRTSAENTQYRSMLLQKSEESLEAYLGSQAEVDLARLSSLTSAFHAGATSLELRKMDLVQSSVVSDPAATDMENVRALIIEGTWSIEIEHVDVRIVLASRPDLTLLRRIKRGREPITPELEQVVLSEQRKLGQLRERCDIEIYDDYFVEFPSRRFRGGFSPRTSEGSTPSVEQFISTQHREMLTKRRKGQRITYSNEAPFCPIPSVSGQDASLHAIRMLHTMTVAQGILASSSSVINYHRIWARDSVITGLGGLLAKDEQLMQGLKASLDILARCAGPDGQVPSNVAVKESGELDGVSYGGLAGRVDTIAWYVIGVCQYVNATGDEAFLMAHKPTIEKGLKLLSVWEFNSRGLVYMPQGGDWADEYIYHGYVLLPQLLRLWALQVYGALGEDALLKEQAMDLRTLLEINYWPSEQFIDHALIYHRKAYESYLKDREIGRYFEACLNPMGYSRQFDFLGNSIACLLKLGTLEQRTSILETGQSIVHNLPLKLCPAFWPPIFETDPEWPSLHLSFKDKFRNEPFRYHNGGSWPMVTGWWGSALLTEGYRDDAIAVLNTLHVANSMGQDENVWEFNECFTSITGAPDGVTPCAWSAAAPLMLNAQLSGRSSLTFGNP